MIILDATIRLKQILKLNFMVFDDWESVGKYIVDQRIVRCPSQIGWKLHGEPTDYRRIVQFPRKSVGKGYVFL